MIPRIKICGITRTEDAMTAAHLGVDALGFIFVKKSPRFIEVQAAAEIIRGLPSFVSRVGVFIDEPIENIVQICRTAMIDTVQLHGSETPEFCTQVPFPVIKSISVREDTDISIIDSYRTSAILLDTWSTGTSGGTGKTFDWRIAQRASLRNEHIILAGGLGPSNIEDALQSVQPYGVDINSGVEIKPGIKNPHKMRDVVRMVRNFTNQANRF
jgi:phosphoribosylanthranilate isomerase